MTRRENTRRTSKRLNNHPSHPNSNSDHPRRTKGRARTRASGLKIIDDPMGDEKRLKDQLTQMGLYAVNTLGDGNCLFRALSDQLYGNPGRHLEIRHQVCNYLAQHESRYKAFVDMDEEESWESHLEQMAKQGTYGGHLELSAFANSYRRSIKIIQPGMVYVISYEDESPGSGLKKIKGKEKEKTNQANDFRSTPSSEPTLYLVYHQWEHYSSVRNLGGPHSGIPCIRENDPQRNLEPPRSIHRNGQQSDLVNTPTSLSSDQQLFNGSKPSNILAYRESVSSPPSAGSSTAPNSSAVHSTSSPSSSLSNRNRETTECSDKDRSPEGMNPRKDDEHAEPDATTTDDLDLSISRIDQNPKRNKRATVTRDHLKPTTLSQRALQYPPPRQQRLNHGRDSPQRLKPMSKKEKRLAKRNQSRPPFSTDHDRQPELKIETVGLFKELKV